LRESYRREGEKNQKEEVYMKQKQMSRSLFEDSSLLAEIEEARKFKIDFYRRRRAEIPWTIETSIVLGSEQRG